MMMCGKLHRLRCRRWRPHWPARCRRNHPPAIPVVVLFHTSRSTKSVLFNTSLTCVVAIGFATYAPQWRTGLAKRTQALSTHRRLQVTRGLGCGRSCDGGGRRCLGFARAVRLTIVRFCTVVRVAVRLANRRYRAIDIKAVGRRFRVFLTRFAARRCTFKLVDRFVFVVGGAQRKVVKRRATAVLQARYRLVVRPFRAITVAPASESMCTSDFADTTWFRTTKWIGTTESTLRTWFTSTGRLTHRTFNLQCDRS
mmetsp:Transcript_22871/g.38874  ORF Transcript_22871/g.38874 Transcript_22871/m.38874 type:complete len:254 (-) Transcript_22871:1228-1989(-)